MKISLSLLTTSAFCLLGALSQTSCSSGGYAVTTGPGPGYAYGPGYPVSAWNTSGFYGGAAYYRGASWNNSGSYHNSRGGSASWDDGSGSASGWRGGSASWGGGSGSATGWRGGTASWDDGSGSWHAWVRLISSTHARMSTIRAYAASSAKGTLEPFEFDPGDLAPEEVEIKVSYCGICHSDLSMLDNDWGMSAYPFVPGHEVAGTIVALGREAKGLKIGQRVGLGWSASSCLSCPQCLSGDHNLCATTQATIVGRHGGFADRVRAQWTWVRPLPEALDLTKAGPLLCGGTTVFAPLLINGISPTARVGVIGIGGLGHMALQFANKWGCEVHAFTTSDSKAEEARRFGAHYVHNTRQDHALKPLTGRLDLILSTINVPQDIPGLLGTLAPKGRLHVVGAVLEPMAVPALGLIFGQKEISGSPTGSPETIDAMLAFSARHGIAPMTEHFPMSRVNEAMDRLRSGQARYRIVLENDWND